MWNFLTQVKSRQSEPAAKLEERNQGGRRSSIIEFGMDDSMESIPDNFEVCKGLVLTLD